MPTPPFDHEIAHVLATQDDVVVSLAPEDIAPLRARVVRPDDASITLDGAYELTTVTASREGHPDTEIVLLRPRGQAGPFPVLFHVHGGGLVVGSAYDDLGSITAMAQPGGFAVAAVEYRLAPENPYPAAIDDVYTGLSWLATHAAEWDLDPARIVVEGVSAGGGLAAAAALVARDRGTPSLLGQMLLCPMLDDRNDSESAHQMAGLGAWDRTANETGWAAYLGEDRGEVPIYAAPGRADDLSDLPPTFIDVGSAETFRTENIAYANLLWTHGGDAELHVWPGGAHGFDALAPEAALTRDARAVRRQWLARLLERHALRAHHAPGA